VAYTGTNAASGFSAGAAAPSGYETDMSNLIMAWYHCGFFTARFQERYRR